MNTDKETYCEVAVGRVGIYNPETNNDKNKSVNDVSRGESQCVLTQNNTSLTNEQTLWKIPDEKHLVKFCTSLKYLCESLLTARVDKNLRILSNSFPLPFALVYVSRTHLGSLYCNNIRMGSSLD